jgi:hypothetical protein
LHTRWFSKMLMHCRFGMIDLGIQSWDDEENHRQFYWSWFEQC